MMYLIIIFCSPLYFIIRRRWGAFVLNTILYILALLTILLFGIGIFFWLLAVGHAGWYLRKELMEEQAQMIATKMAAEMNKKEDG